MERRGRAEPRPGAEKMYRSINKMTILTPFPLPGGEQMGGKRRGVPVKTLKKLLKKAGLKTTGKKAALTRRAKQAKLVKKGGVDETPAERAARLAREAAAAEEQEDMSSNDTPSNDTSTNGTPTGKGRKRKGKSRSKKYFF